MKEHLGHAWMAPDDGPTDPEYAAADEGIALAVLAETPTADADFRRRVEGELPFLRRIARRWHRDQASADDLIQETLLRALTNAQLWEPGSNLQGWLFTIMRNQFLAAAARSKRSDLALHTIGVAEADLSASLPEARLMIRDVERALRRLPSDQRTAVKFIGIDGKSYEEAAHLMRMSVAAVRCHLARGRKCVRTMVLGDAMRPSPASIQPQEAAGAAAGRRDPVTRRPAAFAEPAFA